MNKKTFDALHTVLELAIKSITTIEHDVACQEVMFWLTEVEEKDFDESLDGGPLVPRS